MAQQAAAEAIDFNVPSTWLDGNGFVSVVDVDLKLLLKKQEDKNKYHRLPPWGKLMAISI